MWLECGEVQGRPIGGSIPQRARAGGGTFCWRCFTKQFAEGVSGNYPINTYDGEFYHTFVDFALPARGAPVSFAHTYSSVVAQQDTAAGTHGPLGWGWTGSAGVSMTWDFDTTASYATTDVVSI